jgi:extracellular matrix protein 14
MNPNASQGYKWKRRSTDAGTRVTKKPKKSPTPTDPCHHWFPGHRAFEAPEVNNLANWITTLPNLIGFFNLRSYGQMRKDYADRI